MQHFSVSKLNIQYNVANILFAEIVIVRWMIMIYIIIHITTTITAIYLYSYVVVLGLESYHKNIL